MDRLVKLFEPGRIGQMEVKNRIIMGPLGHGFTFATKPDGYVTDRLIAFYEARARGGVGLIQLTTAALGHPFATGLMFSPGILSIIDDEHIPSARQFTDAMHKHGAKVSFNITHHGSAIVRAVQMRPPTEHPELMRVISASGSKDPATGFEIHAATLDEINGIVKAFGEAAKRGKAAGFDCVRIQGCHSYLIRQFLSPRTNKRTDQYGGSVENRARLACEVIREVRNAAGRDYPILIRMNGYEHLEGGISLEEAVQQARLFEQAGADAIDVSSGPPETSHWQFVSMYQPSGALVDSSEAIKKAVKVPVITVGKINALNGEKILREGSADFVQIARGLMADEELPNKAQEGRIDEIRPCIYCGHCQSGGTQGAYANCTVNVGMGKELEFKIEPAAQRKKIMVVGGGPAGMEAARNLAQRGHSVSLYEAGHALGGQWALVANHLPEQASLITYLSAGMKRAGVQVSLNSPVTVQKVQQIKPDVVLIATGSKSAGLDVLGADGRNVVQATDVLAGKAKTGNEVVVVGGRTVGLNAALALARQGKKVSVVTRGKIGRGLIANQKHSLLEYMVQYGVRLFPNSRVDSISENGVNFWWDSGTENAENIFTFLKADTVVLAVGSANDNALADQLSGVAPEVHTIGDATGKRSVFAAIREGSELGRKI